MTTGAVWFRRDLRLDDNPAWAAATAENDEVVALLVLDRRLLAAAGDRRRDHYLAHAAALDRELRDLGAALTVREGPAPTAVAEVVSESGADRLYRNADGSHYARDRDRDVDTALMIDVLELFGNLVHEPGAVLTAKGTLSKVFTPFHRAWLAKDPTPWPEPGSGSVRALTGDELPAPGRPVEESGSDSAWSRLSRWSEQVSDYPTTRDLPAVDGTSELSADLKFGTISARRVVDTLDPDDAGAAAFIRQLAWRDWYAHTLYQHPELPDVALRSEYDLIRWRDDPDGFTSWCGGRTGFPLVDAGMRQLAETGWMHNRVRMICASFLVKDLLIDWRQGERWFRHHLIDGDVAQNAGNWQWVAGTGPDAAPYFRVFNPTAQSRRYDPSGEYIRRFVPELADLSDDAIHEPVGAAPLELASAGVVLGDDYPNPIVDHGEARARALDAYSEALGTR